MENGKFRVSSEPRCKMGTTDTITKKTPITLGQKQSNQNCLNNWISLSILVQDTKVILKIEKYTLDT